MSFEIEHYRINNLIDSIYEGNPVNTIDFKRHLRADIALDKKVYKAHGGRPLKSEYYYNNELVALIKFEFTTNSSNFVTQRIEKLHYITITDSESPEIIIKKKTYSMNNLVDAELMMKEREASRKSVIQSLKVFLGGVLMQALQMPMDQVTLIIEPFVTEYKDEMDGFVEYGYSHFKDELLAIDLQNTNYTWLSIPVDANGTTVRDYMVYQLS